MSIRLYILVSAFLSGAICSVGQSIEISYLEFANNNLVLHYDLLDSVAERFYTIRLYSSKDNFLNPLEKIEGDIGFEIKPGPNKKIVWKVKEELGELFEGGVSLEIRGRIFIPFIILEQINQYKVFKRLRKYDLTWRGGSPQNILNFDLYDGDEKSLTFPNVANVSHHQFEFPSYIKPGKNYRFKVSDTKNKDEVVYTKSFRIKRKIPLLLKAIPLTVVLTSVAYLILNKPDVEPPIFPPILPK